MVYAKQTWVDGAAGGTPLSAARLNHIEDGIEAVTGVGVTPRFVTQHVTNSVGDEPGPVVCWTADDGYTSMIGYFDVLNNAGIKGTLFLTSTYVDKSGSHPTWGPYITTAEVNQIIAGGHEIASHSTLHESYTDYLAANGAAALHAMNVQAVTDIESMFPGVTVRTGAYPAGHYNARVAEIVGRTHTYFRASKGTTVTDVNDPHAVPSIDVFTLSEAQIKAHVDTVVANRGMVVFLVHGAMDAAHHTKIANVVAYATAQGCQQKPFYDAMLERTAFKSTRHMVDTSGNVFSPAIRTDRVQIERQDNVSGAWELDIDEVTSAPYIQGVGQQTPIEFRSSVILGQNSSHGIRIGRRTVFWDAVTTNLSATLTSASAGFRADDVGLTITGTGIPGGTTILSVESLTSVTLSAAATVTASAVNITLGRPLPPTLSVANDFLVYGPFQQHGTSLPFHGFYINGIIAGSIDPSQWVRSGSGGSMLIDSGSGGSYITLKGFGVKLLTQDGSKTATMLTRSGSPAASSMQPVGSVVMRTDATPATGALYVKESGDATNAGWSAVQTRTGIYVQEGANARQGVATMVAGTVTVANTTVTANSRIFLTIQSPGGTPGAVYVSARTAATSFDITSTSGTDTSAVAYQICEPG